MLVTCLTPTTKARRDWIPQVIDIFDSQTHVDKELLFVAEDDWIAEFCTRPEIRYVVSIGMIGPKRNAGVQAARGQVVCHFDDDDMSAPGRIADQLARLDESGKPVTGYCAALFTDGKGGWWKYHGPEQYFAFGTSLCYRRQWAIDHPFERQHVGEDNAFGAFAASARQFTSVDAGEMIIASIHDGNTSPRPAPHIGSCWLPVLDPPKVLPFRFF